MTGATSVAWPSWGAALLFGLPNPQRPGLLAFCLVIARATLGGLLVSVPAIAIWGEGTIGGGVPRLVVTFGWVVFEELARLAFAYRAERPGRALLLFLVLIVAVETLTYRTGGHRFAAFLVGRASSMALAGVRRGRRTPHRLQLLGARHRRRAHRPPSNPLIE